MQTKIVSDEQVQKLKIDNILIKFPLKGDPQESFGVTDPKNYTLYLITNIVNSTTTSEFHLTTERLIGAMIPGPGTNNKYPAVLIKSSAALVKEEVWWLQS